MSGYNIATSLHKHTYTQQQQQNTLYSIITTTTIAGKIAMWEKKGRKNVLI